MRTLWVLLVMLVAVIFAVQNAAMVQINVLFWRLEASLAIVIAICFAVGAVGGVLVSMPRLYRMRAHEKRLRARLADLGVDDSDEESAASRVPSSMKQTAEAQSRSSMLRP